AGAAIAFLRQRSGRFGISGTAATIGIGLSLIALVYRHPDPAWDALGLPIDRRDSLCNRAHRRTHDSGMGNRALLGSAALVWPNLLPPLPLALHAHVGVRLEAAAACRRTRNCDRLRVDTLDRRADTAVSAGPETTEFRLSVCLERGGARSRARSP